MLSGRREILHSLDPSILLQERKTNTLPPWEGSFKDPTPHKSPGFLLLTSRDGQLVKRKHKITEKGKTELSNNNLHVSHHVPHLLSFKLSPKNKTQPRDTLLRLVSGSTLELRRSSRVPSHRSLPVSKDSLQTARTR